MAFEPFIPWPKQMQQLTDKLDDIIVELELFLDEAPKKETTDEAPE
jgi:hypothetical protein